jgi:hypothetical protein
MKKLILTILLLMGNAASALGAPINNLESGQAALGVIAQGGERNSTYYVETQCTPTLTLGFQETDWVNSGNMADFYAQFRLNSEDQDNSLRLIIGSRTYDSKSSSYLGLALIKQVSDAWDAYASGIAGSGFQEIQIGGNYDLSDNAFLNFNYRTTRYEGNKSGIGIGIGCKF